MSGRVESTTRRRGSVEKNPGPTALCSACLCLLLLPISAWSAAGKGPGSFAGRIGGADVQLQGTCSRAEGSFQFWSDGTEFAVNRDQNGDGAYLNIMVMGSMAALNYNRDGQKIYNGTFTYTELTDKSLTADTRMGRDELPAQFEVRCE